MKRSKPDHRPEDQPAHQAWRSMLLLQARLLGEVERKSAAAGGLPVAWFDLLSVLATTPGQRLRFRELIDYVVLTRAGLSRLVTRIEQAGMLKRESCHGDARGLILKLTSEGDKALRRSSPIYREVLQVRFAAHLPPAIAGTVAAALREVLTANDWLPEARPVKVNVPKRRS